MDYSRTGPPNRQSDEQYCHSLSALESGKSIVLSFPLDERMYRRLYPTDLIQTALLQIILWIPTGPQT
jgi:hypothetical protein